MQYEGWVLKRAAENDYIQYLDHGDGVDETKSVKKLTDLTHCVLFTCAVYYM